MEEQNTTVFSNTTYDKNGSPGHDYPQQPAGYYPAQNNAMNSSPVVVTQPAPNYTQVVPMKVTTNLAYFATMCCFFPLGIFAVKKVKKAKAANDRGDLESARKYSSDARKFSFIAIGIGLVSMIIFIVVLVTVIIPYFKAAFTVEDTSTSYGNGYRYGYNYPYNGYNR